MERLSKGYAGLERREMAPSQLNVITLEGSGSNEVCPVNQGWFVQKPLTVVGQECAFDGPAALPRSGIGEHVCEWD
jgi:hypothetical protein